MFKKMFGFNLKLNPNKNLNQNNFDLNKEIARHICLAQISSDGGKHKYLHQMKGSKRAYKNGYSQKEVELFKAISLINSKEKSLVDFSFWVEQRPDQNGNTSRVVYFHHKGSNSQISFHCFGGEMKKLVGKGCPTSWDRNPGGSHLTTNKLIKLYKLN